MSKKLTSEDWSVGWQVLMAVFIVLIMLLAAGLVVYMFILLMGWWVLVLPALALMAFLIVYGGAVYNRNETEKYRAAHPNWKEEEENDRRIADAAWSDDL